MCSSACRRYGIYDTADAVTVTYLIRHSYIRRIPRFFALFSAFLSRPSRGPEFSLGLRISYRSGPGVASTPHSVTFIVLLRNSVWFRRHRGSSSKRFSLWMSDHCAGLERLQQLLDAINDVGLIVRQLIYRVMDARDADRTLRRLEHPGLSDDAAKNVIVVDLPTKQCEEFLRLQVIKEYLQTLCVWPTKKETISMLRESTCHRLQVYRNYTKITEALWLSLQEKCVLKQQIFEQESH